jgi:hypothetical protein
MSTCRFIDACSEYRYLLERDYPEKAALKIVSDRHRLGRDERNCLFRGIVAPRLAEQRREKILEPVGGSGSGRSLGVDWYNCLITVESYLKGGIVFLAEDGMTRDGAGLHGSYRVTELTTGALEALTDALRFLEPAGVEVFVDAPLAHSAAMAERLRMAWAEERWAADVALVHTADHRLKLFRGMVASADSVILDAAREVIDLPRLALQRTWSFSPRPVTSLFA